MKYAKCKHCGTQVSSAGIRGHLRFKHGIENPTISDFEILGEIPKQEENTAPVLENYHQNPMYSKVVTSSTAPYPIQFQGMQPDPLDLMEKQLAQQMRIQNLQLMIKQLNTPQGLQQKDTLTEVVTVMDLIDKIQDRALERAKLGIEPSEGMSTEDQMIMQLLQGIMNRPSPTSIPQQNTQLPTTPVQNLPIQLNNPDGEEQMFFGEQFIRKKIKEGKITKEQIVQFLKANGKELPDNLIDEYIEDCKQDDKI